MQNKFRIRQAKKDDKAKVIDLFIHSIANKKNLLNASLVESTFVNEFINNAIEQGNLLVVENLENELELIGEVHYYYNTTLNSSDEYSRELTFFSRLERRKEDIDSDLIEWLFGEIEKKHKDVFSVEITTPVRDTACVEAYRERGISIEENYRGRLKNQNDSYKTVVPLAWVNPSFN